jgi:HD-GYP domain-containing protein (c-di-GMP phosphodiesterase class II)
MAERRAGDTIARIGGEEFAWVLPDTDGDAAYGAAERARTAIADSAFTGAGRQTVSAGVCSLDYAGDAHELFQHADVALYWAKAAGRNATVPYSPDKGTLPAHEERAQRMRRAKPLAVMRSLANAVDAKDSLTQRHSERVADMAEQLAAVRGWGGEERAQLRDAALVHDVGKIGVPDRILLKPGKLTSEEYEQVKTHAALGAQMLGALATPQQLDWIRHHHERYDGHGYPDRLAGGEITEGASLLAVADAWDAITVTRPYGPARSASEALEEVRRGAGTHFAPDAVAALMALKESEV